MSTALVLSGDRAGGARLPGRLAVAQRVPGQAASRASTCAEHGSGNAGTTNAFRVLGSRLGIAVLIADILKGVVPVVLARLAQHPVVTVLVAFACVARPQLLDLPAGQGGKGWPPAPGPPLAMMPIPMAISWRLSSCSCSAPAIVSIASIICTIMFPVMAVVFHQPLPYIVVCLCHVRGGAVGPPGQLRQAVEARGAAGLLSLEREETRRRLPCDPLLTLWALERGELPMERTWTPPAEGVCRVAVVGAGSAGVRRSPTTW